MSAKTRPSAKSKLLNLKSLKGRRAERHIFILFVWEKTFAHKFFQLETLIFFIMLVVLNPGDTPKPQYSRSSFKKANAFFCIISELYSRGVSGLARLWQEKVYSGQSGPSSITSSSSISSSSNPSIRFLLRQVPFSIFPIYTSGIFGRFFLPKEL